MASNAVPDALGLDAVASTDACVTLNRDDAMVVGEESGDDSDDDWPVVVFLESNKVSCKLSNHCRCCMKSCTVVVSLGEGKSPPVLSITFRKRVSASLKILEDEFLVGSCCCKGATISTS